MANISKNNHQNRAQTRRVRVFKLGRFSASELRTCSEPDFSSIFDVDVLEEVQCNEDCRSNVGRASVYTFEVILEAFHITI